MEVVQIVGFYPPHLGGQEAVVEELATLQADEHRVTVYTSNLGAAGAAPVEQRAGRAGRIRVVRQRAALVANVPLMPGLLIRLLRHAPKPDIVHVHTGHALVPEIVALAARLRGIRYIAHQHLMIRPSTRVGQILLPLYQRMLYAPFLRRADRVICLTAAMRDEVTAVFGVDPARVAVIPNGVNTARFRPRPQPRNLNEFLFVGRLSAQKNVDALLDAAAVLRERGREVSVRIVGEGENLGRLQSKAAMLGLTNVIFEGRRGPTEIADAYARATAVVMPSTHEGMPLVLLEAMAAGTPVVASVLPEIVEVGGDAIVTADPATPRTLADALARILDDRDLRARLSVAAASRAENYAWRVVATTVSELYAEVLAA